MTSPNQYAIGVSTHVDFELAMDQVVQQLDLKLQGQVDLVSAFIAGHSADATSELTSRLNAFSPRHVIGSNSVGVIAGQSEYYNNEPAIVVWAAQLPEIQLTQFHLQYEQSIDGGAITGWPDDSTCLDEDSLVLAIGDPYSFPMDLLLHRLNEDRPNVRVVGGMASGAARPGDWSLLHGDQQRNYGANLIAMRGDCLPVPIVSQGCRPVGKPMIVTACERNEIHMLGGIPATQQLFDLFDSLPTREQKQLNSGLHMGLAMTEYKDEFGYGDFLIRNVTGFDKQTGAINIGAYTRVGQTVQFHVRDHQTASLDLAEACDQFNTESKLPGQSALLFSCNGRGPHLFPEPHHDALLLSEKLGIDSLAGCFAAGEVGPVGQQNHVHGFTASIAVFR